MTKVLVVDDDPDIRALISAWLRGSGYQVILGADGYQAVQLARTQQPNVILLDINMPAAAGFVVQERIQRITSVAAIPIISMSADRSRGAAALAAGAVRFLAKPLHKETLLGAIVEVCGPAR